MLKTKFYLTSSLSSLAVDIMRVVTVSEEPESSFSSIHQTVWAAGEEALALVTLVVEVALLLVTNRLGAGLTGVAASQPQASAIVGASVVIIGVGSLGRLGHSDPGRGVHRQGAGPEVWLPVQEAVASVVVWVDVVTESILVHGAAASVFTELTIDWTNQPHCYQVLYFRDTRRKKEKSQPMVDTRAEKMHWDRHFKRACRLDWGEQEHVEWLAH